jgi:glycosyltransferase involved in cell wall biosynthesis
LNGLRLVVWHVSRELAQRHEVSVVAFRWPDQHGDPPAGVTCHDLAAGVPSLRARLRERALSLARRQPVDAVRLGARIGAAAASLRACHSYDVAHVTGAAIADVAVALRGLPALIAPLDAWPVNVAAASAMASGLQRRWLDRQARIDRRYTAQAYRPFARVVLVSDEDAQATAAIDPHLATRVIANGVDTAHYGAAPGVERDRRSMLFTGTLSYPPNIAAAAFLALDVLPRVRRDLADARLVIAGRAPGAEVLALAGQPGVTIVAEADDLRPLLATAGVFACAMTRGTGIKNKLLEAMACGVPSVSTTLGRRGLAVTDGRELLVADEPAQFAQSIVQILTSPSLADRLARQARQYVVEHHSWAAVARRYEALYAEILDVRQH